jgi:hypothetical protein
MEYNGAMRFSVLLLLFLSTAAAASDSLTTARQFLELGLPRLALARVARDAPASPSAPNWFEWESLRLSALSRANEPAALLERVARLPADLPLEFRQQVLGHAAWAYLELGDGRAARERLARLLWDHPPSSLDHRFARRLVIRAWLAEKRPEEAYRAMLRYQQDFAPLPRETAAEFVRGLLAAGRAADALTFANALEPGGALATLLALKAGLVAPASALGQARALLAREPGERDALWLAAEAAQAAQDAKGRLDALEAQVNAGASDQLPVLWQAYVSLAEATGNNAQLLQNDDASWLAMGSGLATTDALLARAVHAHLARSGQEVATRRTALARLVASLLASGREETALRLVAAAPFADKPLDLDKALAIFSDAAEALPEGERRLAWLAAARYAAARGRFDLAADHAMRAVLASGNQPFDVTGTQALKLAVDALEQAGWREDAQSFRQRMLAARAPAPKPVAKPATRARKPR